MAARLVTGPYLLDLGFLAVVLPVSSEMIRRVVKDSIALRNSEERQRAILQTAMDGCWLADTNGRLLEVNETYCRMSGYSAQELRGMRISERRGRRVRRRNRRPRASDRGAGRGSF